MDLHVFRQLGRPKKFRKILLERLTEPLHLNIASALVALGGSFRQRVALDLVVRQQYAFGLLSAADLAKSEGIRRIFAVELGVAEGAGLINMGLIAARVAAATGVAINVIGIDGGAGLPQPADFRDHPERFAAGDFPMPDPGLLRRQLPGGVELLVGDLEASVLHLRRRLSPEAPLGFVALDLDFYSSTVQALALLGGPPDHYLAAFPTYLDDIDGPFTNPWCGELAAVGAFNEAQPCRKIAPWAGLRAERLCKNALWIEKMYLTHVLDHPRRQPGRRPDTPQRLHNTYL